MLLDWPPKSPDANPIENSWHEIKTAANRRQLRTAAELWNALQEAWQQKVFRDIWTQSGGQEAGTLGTEEPVKGFNFSSRY